MTVVTETLTIRLPVQAANRLRRIAEIAHRPIDDVVAETLQSTLPPLLDDLPAAFQADLTTLETWSNEALRQQMVAKLDNNSLTRYDSLLAKNSAGTINEFERQAMDVLRAQADLIIYRKAYAALLLKWRGERVPTVAELETPV